MRHLSLCLCLVDLLTQRKLLPIRAWQLRCEVRSRLLWKQSGTSPKKAQKAKKNLVQRRKGKTGEARNLKKAHKDGDFLQKVTRETKVASRLCFSGAGD